ncbi:MAG: carboxylating nicotinate-nucleotide diphosphorylase [Clostridiales bacterium]|nr:carboxylating nicotinate-nucleotide diphosphorylase [Clostridiales bacterium]
MLNKNMIEDIVKRALQEDIGTGDITTLSTVKKDVEITGNFLAKENGILCGLEVIKAVFWALDESITFISAYRDGSVLENGTVFAKVKGNAHAILSAERVALNLLQRMCGIATYTRILSDQIQGYKTKIIDTRKTIPGLRVLDKYAVRVGGGYNHRYNLSDGVLIKDNHITAAGSITEAVNSARMMIPHTLKIEVEVQNSHEVKEALEVGADIIMLDNMNTAQMKEAVDFIAGRALVEASGNMDRKSLLEVAQTGVDFISLGALTHSVKALDISLKF